MRSLEARETEPSVLPHTTPCFASPPHTAETPDPPFQFCEDNYAITPYIAECTNALSNIAYIAFGLLGISHARSQNLPQRVQTCHASLVVLGIGSTLFHGMKRAL